MKAIVNYFKNIIDTPPPRSLLALICITFVNAAVIVASLAMPTIELPVDYAAMFHANLWAGMIATTLFLVGCFNGALICASMIDSGSKGRPKPTVNKMRVWFGLLMTAQIGLLLAWHGPKADLMLLIGGQVCFQIFLFIKTSGFRKAYYD